MTRRATVDLLAEKLSRLTGTEFTVLRGRVPVYDNKPERTVMRYALRATRDGHSHVFGGGRPMTLREITGWTASLCDMMMMGFIRAERGE